ncbi:MAG: glycosyltransferase [Chitinophagales bacterium]|nr:glycosyltransferase [Chitinophagales bacterium]
MNDSKRRIAIVSTNKEKYSETFIRAHVTKLPYYVFYLHTGYLPTKYGMEDLPLACGADAENKTLLKLSIKKFFIENKIELVLAQYGPSGVKMMDICSELNIPLIVYFRGYDAYREDMLKEYAADYRKLFQTASALFVVSNAMKAQLQRLGAQAEKIYYNPSGADTEVFQYHDAGKNPPVFLATGRFEASKSPHLTILAFEKALLQIPDARLVMVGEGYLLEACKILTKALKIEHAVTFKGIVSHKEVAKLMSQCRAFVQHSVTTPSNDTEGTPVAVMEASASGLPVIATLHAGIPEVVEQDKTGFLVEEGDIDGMAQYIINLGENAALASMLGEAGRRKITRDFTAQKNIERLTTVIERLLHH